MVQDPESGVQVPLTVPAGSIPGTFITLRYAVPDAPGAPAAKSAPSAADAPRKRRLSFPSAAVSTPAPQTDVFLHAPSALQSADDYAPPRTGYALQNPSYGV